MGDSRGLAAKRLREVTDEGGIIVQIVWRMEAKQWRIVASLHSGSRVRVITRDVSATGAPDLEELVRLVNALQRECESWLW